MVPRCQNAEEYSIKPKYTKRHLLLRILSNAERKRERASPLRSATAKECRAHTDYHSKHWHQNPLDLNVACLAGAREFVEVRAEVLFFQLKKVRQL